MRIAVSVIKTEWLAVFFVIICVSALFLPVAAGRQGIFHDDQAMEEFPRYFFVARSLQQGIFPLWDPHTWCGAIPFLGRYYADTYYPLLWPFQLLTDLTNIDSAYLTLILLPLWLHYILAAVGMFVLLRMIVGCSRIASVLGGLAYVLSPAFSYSYVWQQVASVQAWLPWLAVFYVQAVRKTNVRTITIAALVLLFIITGAAPSLWPQVAFIWGGIGLSLSISAFLKKESLAGITKPIFLLLAIGTIGTALSAPYLCSFVDAFRHTAEHISLTRQAALADPYGSTPPLYLATLFIPDIFGNISGVLFPALSSLGTVFYWEANLSGGMILSFLVLLGLTGAFLRGKGFVAGGAVHRWLLLAAALYVFSLFCVLGRYTPFYEFTVGIIPGAGALPRPLRYRMLQCFSAAVLAGGGVHLLAGIASVQERMRARKTALFYAGATCIVLFVSIGALGNTGKGFTYPWLGPDADRAQAPEVVVNADTKAGLPQPDAAGDFAEKSLPAKLFSAGALSRHAQRSVFYWFIAAALLLAGAYMAPSGFRTLLVILALAELFFFGAYAFYRGTYSFDRSSPNHARMLRPSASPFVSVASSLESALGNETMRVASGEIFHDNFLRLTGAYALMGYEMHPLEKRFKRALEAAYGSGVDYPWYYRRMMPQPAFMPFLNHFSVAYFLDRTPKPVFASGEEVRPLASGEDIFLHRNSRALPRIYTVSRVIPASEDEQLRQLLSGDLRLAAYIERPSGELKAQPRGLVSHDFDDLQRRNSIRRVSFDHPNRISIDIGVLVPSMLVITDVWYPGWKASIDGHRAAVEKVNYCQRGVWLKEGTHRVVVYFSPFAWHLGLGIAGASVCVLCLAAFFRKKNRFS